MHVRAGLAVCLVAALGIFASMRLDTKGLTSILTIRSRACPESQDASKAQPYKIGWTSTSWRTTCSSPLATSRRALRAKNLNTIDEVPDSSWFTNRIGAEPSSRLKRSRAARSAARRPTPRTGCSSREKTSGAHPGLHGDGCAGRDLVPRVRSSVLPEGATGAVEVATKIFWALRLQPGGIVPDDVRSRSASRSIRRPRSGVRTARGRRFTQDDINAILEARRAKTRTGPIASSPAG